MAGVHSHDLSGLIGTGKAARCRPRPRIGSISILKLPNGGLSSPQFRKWINSGGQIHDILKESLRKLASRKAQMAHFREWII